MSLISVFCGPYLNYTRWQVNPDLPKDGKGDSATDGATKTKRGSAAARPGLMRTTFDEWDTLLVSTQV